MPAPPAPHVNRLAQETSPYLLQHQHNPVDWWPWGPPALAAAQASGRPILLSVGYAACHWCHVMAHESFEDEATAAVMNELFVNIKVDREERPDIDQIYMSALHLMGEQGGWPLTMFLAPNGEPIWGGTYFPKVARYGRPAFVDILREIARLFREEPHRIDSNRRALMARLATQTRASGTVTLGRSDLDAVAQRLLEAIDPIHGGLRGAPKFPQAALFEFLWRAGRRNGEPRFFAAVENTLDHLCEGGIYDHLGGGFARYSVDDRWLVPHFEKMLYDNAQLIDLLTVAFVRSAKPLYRRRVAETVAWLLREMTTPQGAFAASLDADSEGEEGRFYVWSLAEIEKILGPSDGAFLAAYYGVTAAGNFEHHNILNRLHALPDRPVTDRPPQGDHDDDAERARIDDLRARLFAVRERRVHPGLDDKTLADWNGLMIAALAHASAVMNEPAWLQHAIRAFAFIAREMTRGDRLGHSWRDGRLTFPGLSSDFTAMIRAALALFETTGQPAYLEQALVWQQALDRHYADSDSASYFLTANDAEGLVMRPNASTDEAVPNPNAVAAENLVRLSVLTGDDRWRLASDRLFDGLLPVAAPNLFGHIALLNAFDLRLRAAEIVVTGAEPDALVAAALRLPYIDRIVLRAASTQALGSQHPARTAMATAGTDATAFVCVGERCSLPVHEPAHLIAAVDAMNR